MAYSLNPKDLREELKTYKQPVYVASTQPAQQSVAPASTSPYRQQKRSDGGTDFYNGNQKITIEEFSKGTGNQVDAVRGNLAAGGSKFDQDVLTKQYFETKDPEVTKFNTSDVYSQRQRIADLQGLAGRTKFNSQEDIKNRDWAQQQLANIETYGKKQGGNPLTFAQDAVAAAPSAYKRIGEGFGEVFGAGVQGEADKAQADYQQGVAETVRNLTDNMNKTADPVAKERYKQAISNIAAQSDLLSAQQEATQTQVAERTDPTKAAGAVASIGLDVVTAGAGSKLVGAAVKGGQTATAGSKLVNFTNTVLNPQTIRQGAVSGSTLGAAYGGAGTAEQMGADATLQDYASGIGTGAAIGAVTGAAIPATIKAGQVIGDATTTGAKNVARAVENINPQLAQINETLDNYKRAFDVETNPTRREQINQGIAQLNTERRRILERGSIQVPGGKAEGQMWYHGTPRKFDTLKNNQTSYSENRNAGIGTWFSSDRNVADKFTYESIYKNNPESKTGRVIEATPKLNNPKIYEPLSPSQAKQVRSNIESIENQIKETELQRKQYKDATINNNPSGYSWQTDREFTNKIDQLNGALKEEKIKLKDSYDVFQYEADKFDNKKAFADSLKQQGHDGIIIKKTVADASSGTNDQLVVFDIEASAPQVTKTPKQPTTQKSAFEADLEAAGLTPYRKQSKAMREAVDQAVYETDPLLFESGSTGAFEAGIPKIKPSSIKEVTGLSARESGIPPRYLSEKDGRALDDIAAEFEGNRVDGQLTMTSEDMLDVVKRELDARSSSREQGKKITELRNSPDIQKRAEVISRTDPESGLYIDEPLALQRENQIVADLEAAGITAPRQAKTKFTRTVKGSAETSDKLRTAMRGKEGSYTTVTDEQRLFQSDKFLKSRSLKEATTDIKDRLIADKIDDQTASDAIAVAKRLDARSTTKSLQEATEIYEQLAEKFSKAGQLVQAASLLGNRTPEGLRFSAIKSLKKEGVTITPEMTKKIDSFIQQVKKTDAGSYENGLARNNLMQYVAKQLPQRKMSQILQVWKAGLLTSPRTTAGNLVANIVEAILRKGYVDPLANILDAATAFFFTGQRSRKYTLRGTASGTGEGIVKGIKYFKTGYDPRNPSQKFDVRNINYSDKPLGKAAEVYTQAVFRTMGAQDQPFYYAALRNSLYDQALTEASRQKLKGSAKSDFVKQFITEPQTKAMDLADKEARYAVFQNETELGRRASQLKSGTGIGADIAEFLIPFSGVPSSIATRMIERTPIGWATEIVKQIKAKKFDQRAMTQAIANGSMVIPLVGAGVALANSGAMTLGYPTEKKERDLWEAEGKQPYSIKVGDQWLSTNYFQPAGNLLAAGAEYQNAINEGEDPETAYANALAGAGKAFTEQSFLKGVSGGINALTDPTRSAEKFAEQTAGSVVPNIVRTAARATDPVQREMNGIGDAVTAGIPGLRQTLPAKTNIYGDEVPRRGSMIDEIINPFKPSKDLTATNPMTAELRSLQDQGEGITPTQATKSTFKDANGDSLLDDKQMLELNKKVAKQVSTEWKKVMEDPRYAMLSAEDKKTVLTRANDTAYGAVKSELTEVKLTARQKAYLAGEPVDYFDGIELTEEQKQAAKEEAKAKKTTAKKTTKSSTGRKAAKKNYKLNAFGDVSGQVSGNLRKLIEEATIKGV